jgi:uncharacterized membrane protein YkoI
MRLAIKILLVALGVAFLIAGFPSPRTDAATGQEGRDDVAVTGTAADQAKDAAQAVVPGATVRGVERETNDDDTPPSAYEVELTRPDGTPVEVELDADYKVVGTDHEDDGPDDDGPNDD